MLWLAKVVERYLKFSSNRAPYQSKRDGNRVFLVQVCQNSFGRFIKLSVLGSGKGNRIIVIPEGKIGSGWERFARKLLKFVGSFSSISATGNKAASNNGNAKRDNKEQEKLSFNPHIGVSSSRPAPYLAALTDPVKANHGSSIIHRKNVNIKDVEGSRERILNVGMMKGTQDAVLGDEGAVWNPKMLGKLGEVKGSFWHLRAELSGWKDRPESMLKKVDDGLGLVMGLMSSYAPKGGKVSKEGQMGSGSGLENGPSHKPTISHEKFPATGVLHTSSPSKGFRRPKPIVATSSSSKPQSDSSAAGEPFGSFSVTEAATVR